MIFTGSFVFLKNNIENRSFVAVKLNVFMKSIPRWTYLSGLQKKA